MPIHAPSATLTALGGGLLPNCESRSLFQDRFADPQAKEGARKQWFNSFINKSASPQHPDHSWLPATAEILHARLMYRLMVNLAGGVMENANLSLDRYGLPLIPGAAVKGCARRMALQALHDWQGAPASAGQSSTADPTIPCRSGFDDPAAMLAAIARIFGWISNDWSDPSNQSDFIWACHNNRDILAAARALLPTHATFAGTIAFLPASPNRDPGLELDVVTPHHTAYYESTDPNKVATDTEDPVPVYFPAVKPQPDGHFFTFPLIPLRLAKEGDLAHAKNWLAHGLEIFGLGAKTNAGYGFFNVAELEHQKREREQSLQEWCAVEAEALLRKEAEARAAANAHLLAIQPDAELMERFGSLKPDELRGAINKFQYEDKLWPGELSEEAGAAYQVSLLTYLTQTNRLLYDEEKNKSKSKVMLALRKLADKYARTLPE